MFQKTYFLEELHKFYLLLHCLDTDTADSKLLVDTSFAVVASFALRIQHRIGYRSYELSQKGQRKLLGEVLVEQSCWDMSEYPEHNKQRRTIELVMH